MDKKITAVALIPARLGSKRIPKKNIMEFKGHPLLAYTICSALNSKVFDRVIVSTESEEIKEIALAYGAEVPFMRPAEYSEDASEDIDFVLHALGELKKVGPVPDIFSILRPTNPLRQPETIQRAWKHFLLHKDADSLRAVEKCAQHPAKMWILSDDQSRMRPVIERPEKDETPWHSMSYQALPFICVQNASLEIAWSKIPLEQKTIAGKHIVPFITEGYEGFDINFPEDIFLLEHLVDEGRATLPPVRRIK
jgi:N-acylneuraminate cytidylyltransferase